MEPNVELSKLERAFWAVMDKYYLVQPDGSTSQNTRWTSDALYAAHKMGIENHHIRILWTWALRECVEIPNSPLKPIRFNRWPGGDTTSIDDILAMCAYARSIEWTGLPRFLLAVLTFQLGFLGPLEWSHFPGNFKAVFENNVGRFPGVWCALLGAARFPKFLYWPLTKLIIHLKGKDLIDDFVKDRPIDHDAYALTNYLRISTGVSAKSFDDIWDDMFPGGYADLLTSWGGPWPEHPTTKLLKGEFHEPITVTTTDPESGDTLTVRDRSETPREGGATACDLPRGSDQDSQSDINPGRE